MFNKTNYYDFYGGRGGCGCGCVPNGYRHAKPKKKEMLFMDTTLIEDFTVRRIKEGTVRHCEEVCADVVIDNSCLILSTQTSCLDFDVEYSLDLPRAIDWSDKQIFIKVEPCKFIKGPLEVEKTIVTVPYCDFPHLKLTAENLPGFYRAKYDHEGCEHEIKDEVFVEVLLDLRSNIVTTNKLLENGYKTCGERDRYVLYYANSGVLVLERDHCRTRKYGDFR